MSSPRLLIGVSVLSTSLAFLILWRDVPEPAPAPASPVPVARATTAPDHALDRKISALADEVDALWEAQDEAAIAAAPQDASEPDRVAPQPSPEEHTASLKRTLATALSAEASDARWAPEATAELEEALNGLGDRLASIDRVECRATMCVVEFVYEPDRADPSELADALGQLAPWPANVVSSLNTTPDHQGWLYLSREGHGLPPV